jgi:hypothetical protein
MRDENETGLLRALLSKDVAFRNSCRLAAGGNALHLAAFFVLCMEVPAFSQAQTSDTLRLTPVYAFCCVAGLDQRRATRSFDR